MTKSNFSLSVINQKLKQIADIISYSTYGDDINIKIRDAIFLGYYYLYARDQRFINIAEGHFSDILTLVKYQRHLPATLLAQIATGVLFMKRRNLLHNVSLEVLLDIDQRIGSRPTLKRQNKNKAKALISKYYSYSLYDNEASQDELKKKEKLAYIVRTLNGLKEMDIQNYSEIISILDLSKSVYSSTKEYSSTSQVIHFTIAKLVSLIYEDLYFKNKTSTGHMIILSNQLHFLSSNTGDNEYAKLSNKIKEALGLKSLFNLRAIPTLIDDLLFYTSNPTNKNNRQNLLTSMEAYLIRNNLGTEKEISVVGLILLGIVEKSEIDIELYDTIKTLSIPSTT